MDSGKLSKQLEMLPASGLTIELKSPDLFCHYPGLACFLSFFYLLFFLLLLVALSLLEINSWLFVSLVLFLSAYCFILFRQHLLLNHPSSIKKLVFTEQGWCYVQLNNLQVFKADIESDTILTEHLVILNLIEHDLAEFEMAEKKDLLFKKIGFYFAKNHSLFLTADRLGKKKFKETKRLLRFISFSKAIVEQK